MYFKLLYNATHQSKLAGVMSVEFSVIIRLLSARCGELWCMMLPPFPDEEMQKNPSEECECAEEDPQQSDVWPPESL